MGTTPKHFNLRTLARSTGES